MDIAENALWIWHPLPHETARPSGLRDVSAEVQHAEMQARAFMYEYAVCTAVQRTRSTYLITRTRTST